MFKKCPNCYELINDTQNPIFTNDDYEVCSNWCKDDWEADSYNIK